MLSRHLYRIDEVKASCYYALLKRNYREALFWSMELCDTLCSAELLEIMLRAWFYGGGSYQLLVDLVTLMKKDEIGVEDILPFVGALCAAEKDASVFYLLVKGSADWEKQPDTFAFRVSGQTPEMAAIKQRKILFAWILLRCRWSSTSGAGDAWSILLELCQPKMRPVLELLKEQTEFVWESRAVALLLVCGWGHAKVPKYHVDTELVARWSELEGRRARREFRVRAEACLAVTERGKMTRTTTNIEEIREPLTALHGSPYWDTIATEFGGWKPIYKNDASKEAFYDLYFPDDIPDEWSATDQEKSHGCGYVGGGGEDEKRLLMSLYGTSSSLGLVSWTHDAARCGLDLSLYETRQEAWAAIQKSWNLTPRTKKIVLIK